MKNILTIIFLISLSVSSCKKFIEVDGPIDRVSEEVVYQNDANAIAATTNIFYSFSDNKLSVLLAEFGLSADELKVNDAFDLYSQMYTNEIFATTSRSNFYWSPLYGNIFHANIVIEGLGSSPSLSEKVRNQLVGEARFVRALDYFYLVNIFGAVPLVLSSDYKQTAKLNRSPVSDVYKQIVDDLEFAASVLAEDYLSSDLKALSETRLRPNKYTANAMLARVYLYLGEWQKAELEASKVIQQTDKFQLAGSLNEVFLINSDEVIWQVQPVGILAKAPEAIKFVLTTGPAFDKPFGISDDLNSAFESGDERKTAWVGSDLTTGIEYLYPFKYKNEIADADVTEYSVVLRLAEQYLIRAEARAQLGLVIGENSSESDLNSIRARANLPAIQAASKEEMLQAIENERRVELFAEWGHRWFDLKRTGRANELMPSVVTAKGGSWQTTDQLFPIPTEEINANPNLAPQNQGY